MGHHEPGKQWRDLLDQLRLHNIAGAPSTLRLYAALHIAIADAEVAARNRQAFYRRPHPMEIDSGIQPLVPSLSTFAYPSDLAAETGAAERILLFARPEAGGQIKALADESMVALASSGLYLKSDCEAGRNLGFLVAEQVLSVFERRATEPISFCQRAALGTAGGYRNSARGSSF